VNFIDKAYDELSSLRGQLALLPEARLIGTPRRWVERDLSEADLEKQASDHRTDKYYRAENAAKGIKATGNSKAPLRLEVFDAMVDIDESIKELEAAVCDHLGLTPLKGCNGAARITRIIGLLDRITVIEDIADHVLRESARMNRKARQALGEAEPIHKIKARCPICDSMSLRAFTERELVICVDPGCECDDEECPCKFDKPVRHMWPVDQWEDLAAVLNERKSA
jgi:hypothetical protein